MVRDREFHARRRVMPALAALALVASAAASGVAVAQPVTGDTLPFRRGQWATQFSLAVGTAGLGVLRFRSPTRAWLVDATFRGEYGHSDATFFPVDRASDHSSGHAALRLGPRHYERLAHDVAGFAGWGVRGSGSWSWREDPYRLTRRWSVGPYAELGAAYLVTHRLSLGASALLQLDYGNSRSEARYPTTGEMLVERGWELGVLFIPVRMAGTIYF